MVYQMLMETLKVSTVLNTCTKISSCRKMSFMASSGLSVKSNASVRFKQRQLYVILIDLTMCQGIISFSRT